MLFLIDLSSESLGLRYPCGIHYEAQWAYDFYSKIISFVKGDFTQCNSNPQIMAFAQIMTQTD